jgi:hypothetical protein
MNQTYNSGAMRFTRIARWIPHLVLLFGLVPSRTDSDALVITKAMTATTVAEYFVDEDAIRVELEIGVADLQGFKNVVPDGIYERLGHEPMPLEKRLPKFFREDLRVWADDGPPIPGYVEDMVARRRIPRDEVTGTPLPVAKEEGDPIWKGRTRRPSAAQESPRRGGRSFIGVRARFVSGLLAVLCDG